MNITISMVNISLKTEILHSFIFHLLNVCININSNRLHQGWGTYLLSRTAWIVHYCWRAAYNNWFHPKILPLSNYEEVWLLLTYYLSTCLSWSFVLTWCCTLTWVTEILMWVISNVHASRRFPTPGFHRQFTTCKQLKHLNCSLTF